MKPPAELLPGSPRRGFVRWVGQLFPSLWSGLVASVGYLWLGVAFLLSGSVWLLEVGGTHALSNILMFISVPVGVLVLVTAALFPGRTLPRAFMLASVAVTLMVGGTSCADLLTDAKVSLGGALGFASATYGSLALIASVGALGMVVFTPHWANQELRVRQGAWVVRTLRELRVVKASALQRTLGMELDDMIDLLARQISRRRLKLRWEGEHDLVFLQDEVTTRMQLLCETVVERGRAPVSDLAEAVALPEPVVLDWLDELISAGALDASVDRQKHEVLHAPKASREGVQWCPGCGGPLTAIGAGLGRCHGCGREAEL